MKNGMAECSFCRSKLVFSPSKAVSRAYDTHRSKVSSKTRVLNVLLVVGDCILVGLQPILVYMSKVDGEFKFSPVSVNFLTEAAKILFALVMLLIQARNQKVGEKPILSISSFTQAAHNNVLLAVPTFLYAINNYLKFIMQLYFDPATVKMLSNLKVSFLHPSIDDMVLVIAVLLKVVMKRRLSIIQLLSFGASYHTNFDRSINSEFIFLLSVFYSGRLLAFCLLESVTACGSYISEYPTRNQCIYIHGDIFLDPLTRDITVSWFTEFIFVRVLAIIGIAIFKGPGSFNILEGHSKATMLLIFNNAAQGILSSFFFKYAGPYIAFTDTILKKYSSTVATIFTGFASAALFGHRLTINFMLGISTMFISMHQFFSPLAKVKDEGQDGPLEMQDVQKGHRTSDTSFISMTAGANDDASHRVGLEERQPLLPI
ncbi:hypothetical protein C5167_024478 [Papaver somniferum]|uniref:Uncharacterized protein n=1 Tax=Papaver somniferum TaxID=3469 RepID=A0A4Y7JPR6_PAPSO|nr:hypothetical protein C5167_024478 [Papaver somniferum]